MSYGCAAQTASIPSSSRLRPALVARLRRIQVANVTVERERGENPLLLGFAHRGRAKGVESLDDSDLLIDIADWESPEARTTHLAKAMAAGTYGPVLELVAARRNDKKWRRAVFGSERKRSAIQPAKNSASM